ncbi:MAG TPA: hypothetical protein VJH95_03365 [Candidatus Nanoarchaeia archaeon]|nr:hypothetical protein [Candidatus Nanoarchaeia archaeon]
MILSFVFAGIQFKKDKNNLAIAGLSLAILSLVLLFISAVIAAVDIQTQNKESQETVDNCDKIYFDKDAQGWSCEQVCKDICEKEGFNRDLAEVFSTDVGNCSCQCKGCRNKIS